MCGRGSAPRMSKPPLSCTYLYLLYPQRLLLSLKGGHRERLYHFQSCLFRHRTFCFERRLGSTGTALIPWEVLVSHACPSSKGPAVNLLRCITDGLSLRYSVFPQSAPWPLEHFYCARSLPARPGSWGCSQKGQCKCCAENYGTHSRWSDSNGRLPMGCPHAALPTELQRHRCGGGRQSPAAKGEGGLRA